MTSPCGKHVLVGDINNGHRGVQLRSEPADVTVNMLYWGLDTLQRRRIPGVFDSSVDGKALGAIEFIVGHLIGVPGHSGVIQDQQGVVHTRYTYIGAGKRSKGVSASR